MQRAPARRAQRRIVEVDDHRSRRVRRERQRVRVGDGVGHDRVHGGHVDIDIEQVAGSVPVASSGHRPDTVVIAPHLDQRVRRGAGRAHEQVDVLGRRCPHRQLGRAAVPRDPEVAVVGVVVDVVEDAGDLHSGGVDEPSEVVVGRDRELTGQELFHVAGVVARQPERFVRGQVWPLLARVGRESVRVERERERVATEDRFLVDDQSTVRGGVQPEAPPARVRREGPRRRARAPASAPSVCRGPATLRHSMS